MKSYFRYKIKFLKNGKLIQNKNDFEFLAEEIKSFAHNQGCIYSAICKDVDDNYQIYDYVYIEFINDCSYEFIQTFAKLYTEIQLSVVINVTQNINEGRLYDVQFINGKETKCENFHTYNLVEDYEYDMLFKKLQFLEEKFDF